MTRAIVRWPGFELDLIELAYVIERDSPLASRRFLDATDKTLDRIARMPGLGALLNPDTPEFQFVRLWRVRGFPRHLIVYRDLPDRIEAIHALHSSTDWKGLMGVE